VLPWESADEYRAVVEALVAEHGPQGPTEEHLVEEIAGQIRRIASLGIDLVMLQHFLLDDSDALKLLASEVIPAVA